MGKRHDYRSAQQLLQIMRDNGYTDNKLHDDIIETCIRQTGSDVEQVKSMKKTKFSFSSNYNFSRVENKIH
jgi:energy-converting hydrogenase A subunit M